MGTASYAQQRTELFYNPTTIRETKLGILYSCEDADDIPFLVEIGNERYSTQTREMQGIARKVLATLIRSVHESDQSLTLQHYQALSELYGYAREHTPKNPDQRRVIAGLLTLYAKRLRNPAHCWSDVEEREQARHSVDRVEQALFWMEQWSHLRELDMCGAVELLAERLTHPDREISINPLVWPGWRYMSHWRDARFDVNLAYGYVDIDGFSTEAREERKRINTEAFWGDLRYITGKQFACGLGVQKNREEMLLTTTYLCTRTVAILHEKKII